MANNGKVEEASRLAMAARIRCWLSEFSAHEPTVSRRPKVRLWLRALLLALLIPFISWSRGGGAFTQKVRTLESPNGGAFNLIAILPRPTGIHPVVVYLPGPKESQADVERELRQFADLGLAAVSLEHDQTNRSAFDKHFMALRHYLDSQPWVRRDATAWVGLGSGARRLFEFTLQHPDLQPQLLACLGNEVGKEVGSLELATSEHQKVVSNALDGPTSNRLSYASIRCPVLFVLEEQNRNPPVVAAERLAKLLRSDGGIVDLRILPVSSPDFGEDRGIVLRAVAEYCAKQLPRPDYAASLTGCELNTADRKRFNQAMQRAGRRRRELWRAVIATREPERDTMMNVIGGLEDYDLAHITEAQLKEFVYRAWQARRKYPWCRGTPAKIFERFVANPRIYEEPLDDWSAFYEANMSRVVKYCHTTAEASDAVWQWMRVRAVEKTAPGSEQSEILSLIHGDCRDFVVAFTGLARTVGLPVRPAWTFWPTIGNDHYWNEVWSTKEKQWHALDTSALSRGYDYIWVPRVPKSVIQVPTGERRGWNAIADQKWESMTNSIGLFYPSGQVLVRVLNDGGPTLGQRVGVQVWLGNGMGGNAVNAAKFWEPEVFTVASAITDSNGEARFVLGQSAEQPYRIFLDGKGESDWQWLAVRSNCNYTVTLDVGKSMSFDVKATPPALAWLKPESRGSP